MQFINGLGLDEVLGELKRLRQTRSDSKKASKGGSDGAAFKPGDGHEIRRAAATVRRPEIVGGTTVPAAEVAPAPPPRWSLRRLAPARAGVVIGLELVAVGLLVCACERRPYRLIPTHIPGRRYFFQRLSDKESSLPPCTS